MKLKVKLTPLGPYFLGTERNAAYIAESENNSQQSMLSPYFIRSGEYPSQSTLFGILRYAGIRCPKETFTLDDADIQNIGPKSYNLLDNSQNNFGRIRSISSLFLTDSKDNNYIPALHNHQAVQKENGNFPEEPPIFKAFDNFVEVESLDGMRYLPTQYKEKEAYDGAELLCLTDGKLHSSPFYKRVQVGINRKSQRIDENQRKVSGFFKREYVGLKSDYSFCCYAEVNDDFFYHENIIVYIGQGRTPFVINIKEVEDNVQKLTIPSVCLPSKVLQEGNSEKCNVAYAVALSDCYYSDNISNLKNLSSFILAECREYRVFTTNYTEANKHRRYTKNKYALKLLKAGSVFMFMGNERYEHLKSFKGTVQNSHAEIAGFNQFYFSNEHKES